MQCKGLAKLENFVTGANVCQFSREETFVADANLTSWTEVI